jgi:hypothetical protein
MRTIDTQEMECPDEPGNYLDASIGAAKKIELYQFGCSPHTVIGLGFRARNCVVNWRSECCRQRVIARNRQS